MSVPWPSEWLSDAALVSECWLWRGVETQYASATRILVDTLDEHDVLEALLESSKPQLAQIRHKSAQKHFLLTMPFRYQPAHDGRFRKAGQGGIWYGARQLRTACAEVAYWRMRFIRDSEALAACNITTHHTFFAASAEGRGIDLAAPPWNALRKYWLADDYQATQRLAESACENGIDLICYESARDNGGICVAVFNPEILSEPRGGLDASRQQWVCTASARHVFLVSMDGSQRFEWQYEMDISN